MEIKDSGQRHVWETGAQRDMQSGKGKFNLIPPYALLRVARHFEAGGAKYGFFNWQRGIPLSSYLDSAMRHLTEVMDGLEDEDHASAVVWNIMCFIETKRMIEKGILPSTLNDLKQNKLLEGEF